MRITLNKPVLALLLVACVIIFCGMPDFNCNHEQPAEIPVEALGLKAEHQRLNEDYAQKVNRLKAVNDSLEKIVFDNRKQLETQRAKTKDLQRSLEKVLARSEDPSFNRDSLKATSLDFIEAYTLSDSLCQQALTSMDSLMRLKDNTIEACRLHSNQTDSLLRLSISKQIETENKLAAQQRKAEKRKRQTLALGGLLAGVSLGWILGR